MRLNQCTSVHNNLFILNSWTFVTTQAERRATERTCMTLALIIFPLCTVYMTDLCDAYLLSHCNQLWSIKLGHNTFQNLQVMKLKMQQKQKAIQHTDSVFKCTMSYKNLKLITIKSQYRRRIWEKDSLHLSKITEHMYSCTCTQSYQYIEGPMVGLFLWPGQFRQSCSTSNTPPNYTLWI